MIRQTEIILPPFSRGFHLIDAYIKTALQQLPEAGLLHIFIKHTSAAITINENADPTVRIDFESVFNKLIPEGDDDMPAHIKAALIGNSITIPITNGKLNLGVWQGIYLCEFRNHADGRKLVITSME